MLTGSDIHKRYGAVEVLKGVDITVARSAIASSFWLSTGSPGLLGQVILATVATHAARNTRSALGGFEGGTVTYAFLDELQ